MTSKRTLSPFSWIYYSWFSCAMIFSSPKCSRKLYILPTCRRLGPLSGRKALKSTNQKGPMHLAKTVPSSRSADKRHYNPWGWEGLRLTGGMAFWVCLGLYSHLARNAILLSLLLTSSNPVCDCSKPPTRSSESK